MKPVIGSPEEVDVAVRRSEGAEPNEAGCAQIPEEGSEAAVTKTRCAPSSRASMGVGTFSTPTWREAREAGPVRIHSMNKEEHIFQIEVPMEEVFDTPRAAQAGFARADARLRHHSHGDE